MRDISLLAAIFLLPSFAVSAADVSVTGLFNGKAVLVIDGGKPRTLSAGQTLPEGVKLISATSEAAVIEYNGRRQTLTTGQGTRLGAIAGGTGSSQITLTADVRGHFLTTGAINGNPIQFLVDTGATSITLSTSDARRLGVNYLAGAHVYAQTASSVTPAYKVKLDSVRVGGVTANNVDAIVIDGATLPVALLGMSFLNRMEMRRDGLTMTLTKRY
ncbi:MAG TPA: TIGR02281 family clan AA aspartic protease [Burkholderiales bacterium]|nr:TIGR02281 family clan AA aspartic protease [Burkholderiales bacterium]